MASYGNWGKIAWAASHHRYAEGWSGPRIRLCFPALLTSPLVGIVEGRSLCWVSGLASPIQQPLAAESQRCGVSGLIEADFIPVG